MQLLLGSHAKKMLENDILERFVNAMRSMMKPRAK